MRCAGALALLASLAIGGCATHAFLAPVPPGGPQMTLNAVYTEDGADLPLRSFLPAGTPRAAIVGLHGFNDYSNAFSEVGLYFRDRGIALYAYDQRGFGDAPDRGLWVGQRRLLDDLKLVVGLVRRRHPGIPVFLIGESMGGALAMVAMAQPDPPPVDGIVLVAPAVRGRATLTTLQRAVLDVVSHALPWFTVTGQGLGITPSDNIAMLRQLSQDRSIIFHTRTDTIRGLVDLMDAASQAVPRLTGPTLILSGERDQIITPIPTCLMLAALPPRPPAAWRFMIYPHGYHMLLRDRDADLVMADIARWIEDRRATLPSGDERLSGPGEPRPADIAALPTCRDTVESLRAYPAFSALPKPDRAR
jgi:alpha-beta hydrolase superfamily lysophospholipase